jgi:NAD(P)-dependent dehydrogenase (short-subunit alcohol dehydrogenase family)
MSKKIIVTGAAGILGDAVVSHLLDRGWAVAGVDRVAPRAGSAATVGAWSVDLTQEAAVTDAFESLAAQLGGVDGLVNIAGGFVWQTVEAGDIGLWDSMYRINLATAVIASRAILPLLGQGGAVVNVGAAAAARAATGMGAYAASKAGVMALTESMADEFAGRPFRFNAVLPTIIDTPTNRGDMPDADASQWVNPAAAAKVVGFLLSDDAACVTGAGIRLALKG